MPRIAAVWDVAAKANGLEGEIASHTRKLEALERRGRALRAEIGRKVEELAQEESRALRDAAAYGEEEESARRELTAAQQTAKERVALADQADRAGQGTRAIFEAAGAAVAMVEAKRQWLQTREARRAGREATARDLRRQIEELRAQLARYAEALEEDLVERPRESRRPGSGGAQVREDVPRFVPRADRAAQEPPGVPRFDGRAQLPRRAGAKPGLGPQRCRIARRCRLRGRCAPVSRRTDKSLLR